MARRSGTPRGGHAATLAISGALALVVAAALVAFVADDGGGEGRDLRLTAGGPAPAEVAPAPALPNQPPAGEVPDEAMPTTTADSLTVTPVHPRTSPPTPEVRAPAKESSGSSSSPILVPPPATTVAPATGAASEPCPQSDVKVTVATDRAAYGPGQTVQGSSTVENRSATACMLPTRAFFRILNSAGKDVGSFAYTLECRLPVRAEPGRTFTSTFTWDQKDCAGPACVQVPPGTYTVVADWTESGPYSGRTTFQITS